MTVEQASHDETEFTPHAEVGWASWDAYSPEQDFCRWVGAMQRILRPAVVLETGVGIGRITMHLDLDVCFFLGFESDPNWRRPPADPEQATPNAEQMATADLVILDSDPDYRIPETEMWIAHGKPQSVCIAHDCGNGHPPGWPFHHEMRRLVTDAEIPGVFTRNPRGGWMGIHP